MEGSGHGLKYYPNIPFELRMPMENISQDNLSLDPDLKPGTLEHETGVMNTQLWWSVSDLYIGSLNI